jgi:NAD(P)-dependent dehydrogenase (short-subunit alcohol dehydrogenase family)
MPGRSVLITGAAGGLGPAVTAAFLAAGWRAVTPIRPGGDGARLPSGAEPAVADLTDPEAVAQAVAAAAADPARPLRAVVNLVGGFAAGTRVHETPVSDFERLLTLNLRPTYLVTSAALPHLVAAGGGAVVCVSARAALRPFAGAAGYVTAKAAVRAFAEAVAVEYADAGVRCNSVLPGTIDTAANRAAQPEADRSRWVRPDAVASVIRFLASDDSAPVTGTSVPVHPVP